MIIRRWIKNSAVADLITGRGGGGEGWERVAVCVIIIIQRWFEGSAVADLITGVREGGRELQCAF